MVKQLTLLRVTVNAVDEAVSEDSENDEEENERYWDDCKREEEFSLNDAC